MSNSTAKLRSIWKDYECRPEAMVLVPFGPDRIRVAPETSLAWSILAGVMQTHGYDIRTDDTDSYNCRAIKGGTGKSLHSFGIALDVNWSTNPYIDHQGTREVRFSDKETQERRAFDVKQGVADTDMTPVMIEDVLHIKTTAGNPVFRWGGHYKELKDSMHFEIVVGPEELEAGIDPGSIRFGMVGPLPDLGWPDRLDGPETAAAVNQPTGAQSQSARRYEVIAREGLHLRSGPGTEFGIVKLVPARTVVHVLSRKDPWALVDLQGDGLADGHMHLSFLSDLPDGPEPHSSSGTASGISLGALGAAIGGFAGGIVTGLKDILAGVTPELVARTFPGATRAIDIQKNLPFVLAGLRAFGLGDRAMLLMALATIRAETEPFLPLEEGRSIYNTRLAPFDLYDAGTPKGNRLGNTVLGDGPRFKGRGYIQLTGRYNYEMIGKELAISLATRPDLACDPETAGLILACFLARKQGAIRKALKNGDLAAARKLVNGGSHGLQRFTQTYREAEKMFPA